MALALVDQDSYEEVEVDGYSTLEGLAEMWENIPAIRQKARKMGKSLLEWPSPDAVGVPSMKLACILCFRVTVLMWLHTLWDPGGPNVILSEIATKFRIKKYTI